MRTAPELQPNPKTNPFSTIIDAYLQRLINLKGQLTVIDKVETEWSTSQGQTMRDRNGDVFFCREYYKFFPQQTNQLTLIKSYIFNIFIAQNIESFETFLKSLINQILSLQFGSEINRKHFKRVFTTNKSRLNFIKDYLNPLDDWIAGGFKTYEEMFFLLEQIRHAIVHSDQLVGVNDTKIDPESPHFKKYFEMKPLGDRQRIFINVSNANYTMEEMAQFGFMIFDAISKKHSVPVEIG